MSDERALAWDRSTAPPLQREPIEPKQQIVTRNPIALIVLALAMLLAPLGTCLASGHAQTGPAVAGMQHAAGMPMGGMRGHDGSAKHHFCSACQPLFIGTGKTATDGGKVLALAPALIPAAVVIPLRRNDKAPHGWLGRAPPIPPPLPIATKVRLQI